MTASILPGIAASRLVEYAGQTWIHDDALVCYDNADVGTVFRVRGKTGDIFFEVCGHAAESGKPVTQKGWWVQRIDPEGAFDKATPEDVIGAAP